MTMWGDGVEMYELPFQSLVSHSNLLEILFDRMPMGIAILDRAYRLVRCNLTWQEAIVRYTSAEAEQVVPGISFFDLAPGTETEVIPLFERVLAGETVRQEALRLESGGILSYWDSVLSPLIEEGRVVGIVDVTTDATERVEAFQELERTVGRLQEREERLALVMRGTNDGIWDWNIETDEVYFSPRWKGMLGYAEDEIEHRYQAWLRLIHPDDKERALGEIQRHLAGETILFKLEHRLRHKDGEYRWILARGVSVRDADGTPCRMVGSHTDVTARRLTEAALQHQIEFENIITAISTNFINLTFDQIDEGIWQALATIGQFMEVDRSYVFLYSGDRVSMDCTHEWCAEGIEPHIQRLKEIPVDALVWSNDVLLRGEVLHIPRVVDLPPEAEAEREEFLSQDIRSLITVPMVYRGDVMGFLGFDAVRREKTWSAESIKLLKIVGETFVNALEHKRSQAIQEGQRQFLELLATGGSLSETLHALVRIIEEQWPGMLGLVLILDEDGWHLHHGAAVSLPEEYTQSIEGLEIGPLVGSCGTACYRRERVIVEDIAVDPRWDGLRDLAVKYGLGACWSEPVFASDGQVIGTFAMYYRRPRTPTEAELRAIEVAAHLVGVAIEHRRALDALQQAHDDLESRVEQRTAELREANVLLQQEIVQRTQVEEALKRQAEEMEALYRADEELLRHLELDDVLQTLVDVAVAILRADKGSLLVWEEKRARLVARAASGFERTTVAQMVFEAGEGSVGQVIVQGEPIVVEDTRDAPQVARRITDPEGIRSFMHVPIRIGDRMFGVFNVDYVRPRVFSEGEKRLFTALAQRAALAIENAQLYARAQELAVVEERQRLARDLHDAVTQTLFSASLIAEVLPRLWDRDPDEGQRRLKEVQDLTRGALAEMRTLLLELRPAALVEAKLEDLLRQLAEATTGRARVPVELVLDGACVLPTDVKMAVYRTAQEALNNVAKHAGASQVMVHLHCGPNSVRLQVRDDGRGFDVQAIPPNHLGVEIMRERAEAVGAALTIESEPGSGTEVRMAWRGDAPG